MKKRFVLDDWAILALLQGEEPAALRVRRMLEEAAAGEILLYLSIINLGEVYYRVGRIRGRDEAARTVEEIRHLPVTVLPASDEAVFEAATIKMQHAVSYADAFAAAAAARLGASLVTGDPELLQLEGLLRIERLGRGRV